MIGSKTETELQLGPANYVGETAMLEQWVVRTIDVRDWGPDGNSTSLGRHHSFAMDLAGETSVRLLVIDPKTGLAWAPTGDEARRAAQKGAF